ncbi:MAG: 50S ribosomal protein L9 [Candidatus Omnitrophota bacterium]|nr:50S ribosomal protein L9 [Candidatus Omnitrophota bacterium]
MVKKLILLKDVEKLGKSGDIITAKDGYARNYLFPKGLALLATDQNVKAAEANKKQEAEALEKERQEAQGLAEVISRVSCTIAVEAGKDDKLFGSVTAIDIHNALEAEGVSVDKKKIELKEHISQIGIYQIPIKLHPEVVATLKLWVVKK